MRLCHSNVRRDACQHPRRCISWQCMVPVSADRSCRPRTRQPSKVNRRRRTRRGSVADIQPDGWWNSAISSEQTTTPACSISPCCWALFMPLGRQRGAQYRSGTNRSRLLPHGQVKATASPGGPGTEEHLLPPQRRQRMRHAGRIGQSEVRRQQTANASLRCARRRRAPRSAPASCTTGCQAAPRTPPRRCRPSRTRHRHARSSRHMPSVSASIRWCARHPPPTATSRQSPRLSSSPCSLGTVAIAGLLSCPPSRNHVQCRLRKFATRRERPCRSSQARSPGSLAPAVASARPPRSHWQRKAPPPC